LQVITLWELIPEGDLDCKPTGFLTIANQLRWCWMCASVGFMFDPVATAGWLRAHGVEQSVQLLPLLLRVLTSIYHDGYTEVYWIATGLERLTTTVQNHAGRSGPSAWDFEEYVDSLGKESVNEVAAHRTGGISASGSL
jgi:hypothetical protein